MRTSNGQLICLEDHLVQTPYGLLITDLKKGQSLSYAQLKFLDDIRCAFDPLKRSNLVGNSEKEFIEYVQFYGLDAFIYSLKTAHDLALYHTDVPFDAKEKNALLNLKILWQGFEEMGNG